MGKSEPGEGSDPVFADEMPLEAAIFCHVFMLNSVLERTGNRVTEAHGLTMPQWMALGCVGHAGDMGLTHSELGARLMLSKAPITGVVDRLERAGFVRREASESDRRVSRIHATPSGVEVWQEVRGTMRAMAQEHCSALEAGEKGVLLSLLARLLDRVASGDPTLAPMRESLARRQELSRELKMSADAASAQAAPDA
jgi:DNA-binding MarR family transcriptional regulator